MGRDSGPSDWGRRGSGARRGVLELARWAALVGGLVACQPRLLEEPAGERPRDPHGLPEAPGPDPQDPTDERAAVWYGTLCASCHGEQGEGGTAPALDAWAKGRPALVEAIDRTMPLGAPERCAGACAEAVADLILTRFQHSGPAVCDGEAPPPPRQLRLLTRREYARTVRDLFAPPARVCSADHQCELRRESCVSGRCAADPCGLVTFTFDPRGSAPREVVVAGAFNGWGATAATGGWSLTHVPAAGLWVAKRQVAVGSFQYKLVIDGADWRRDEGNPERAPDGFGGENSVLTVRCGEGPSGEGLEAVLAEVTRHFPVESRPEGYAFDNHARSAQVSAVHVAEHLEAAKRLARAALEGGLVARLGGCALGSEACVRRLVGDFGRRAFRRPLEAAELDAFAGLVTGAEDPELGLEVALRVMLASPSFLYRTELGEPAGEGRFRLTGFEIASALSYLLWGTAPDEPLLEAAALGRLEGPEGREAEAQRLLADPRAQETLGAFARMWLGVDPVLGKSKHPGLYPGFTEEVRRALLLELEAFFVHVVFEGSGRFADLLLADFGFASGTTAALYGIADVGGAAPQRVQLGHGRAGILGHAALLATYAHSDQSSPIKRGVFVREHLLCQKFGVPPADAGGLPEVDPNATTRERFRQHSDKPACNACHRYIDEVGFGFERFDAVGRYRETENGHPIDPSGNLNDVEGFGTETDGPFTSLRGLAEVLAESDRARDCFATQLHRFSRGELETAEEACAVRALRERFAARNGDVRALLIELVKDERFVTRRGEDR